MSLNKEETEVKKNIEWLKEKIEREVNRTFGEDEHVYSRGQHKAYTEVLNLISQLDEPEVLSDKWIDEHVDYADVRGGTQAFIHVDDLQNLLVPEQEEITEEQAWEVLSELYDIPNKSYIREAMRVVADYVGNDMTIGELKEQFAKPVIPKFVAEWYESEGKQSSWWNWFYKWGRDESRTDLETKTIRWMQEFNEEVFVNMFLHGYTVEEEQKYYVLDKDDIIMIGKVNNGKVVKRNFHTPLHNFNDLAKKKAQLTEQEIKDYDERYWPFAVKVEEMEE